MERICSHLWLGLLLSGCAAHGSIPNSPPSGSAAIPAAPTSHSNGNLTKMLSIAGFVYQVDNQELVMRSEHAALRFKLSPDQLVSQGKHLTDLHRGDLIRVHVSYQDKGMKVDSFDLLPKPHSNSPEHASLAVPVKSSPNPHIDNLSEKGDKDHEKTKP